MPTVLKNSKEGTVVIAELGTERGEVIEGG